MVGALQARGWWVLSSGTRGAAGLGRPTLTGARPQAHTLTPAVRAWGPGVWCLWEFRTRGTGRGVPKVPEGRCRALSSAGPGAVSSLRKVPAQTRGDHAADPLTLSLWTRALWPGRRRAGSALCSQVGRGSVGEGWPGAPREPLSRMASWASDLSLSGPEVSVGSWQQSGPAPWPCWGVPNGRAHPHQLPQRPPPRCPLRCWPA